MPTIIEKNWTTKEVFDYFNVASNKEVDTVQYLGGIIAKKFTWVKFLKIFKKQFQIIQI